MKYHCAYGYINLLRTLISLVFIFVIGLCALVFFISQSGGVILFAFICPIYIVLMIKIVPMFVASHLYTTKRNSFIVSAGIIFRKIRHIPRTAVISMNIRQSFIEKVFRVMSIELMIGSGIVCLHGLSESDARKIFKYRS